MRSFAYGVAVPVRVTTGAVPAVPMVMVAERAVGAAGANGLKVTMTVQVAPVARFAAVQVPPVRVKSPVLKATGVGAVAAPLFVTVNVLVAVVVPDTGTVPKLWVSGDTPRSVTVPANAALCVPAASVTDRVAFFT